VWLSADPVRNGSGDDAAHSVANRQNGHQHKPELKPAWTPRSSPLRDDHQAGAGPTNVHEPEHIKLQVVSTSPGVKSTFSERSRRREPCRWDVSFAVAGDLRQTVTIQEPDAERHHGSRHSIGLDQGFGQRRRIHAGQSESGHHEPRDQAVRLRRTI